MVPQVHLEPLTLLDTLGVTLDMLTSMVPFVYLQPSTRLDTLGVTLDMLTSRVPQAHLEHLNIIYFYIPLYITFYIPLLIAFWLQSEPMGNATASQSSVPNDAIKKARHTNGAPQ